MKIYEQWLFYQILYHFSGLNFNVIKPTAIFKIYIITIGSEHKRAYMMRILLLYSCNFVILTM